MQLHTTSSTVTLDPDQKYKIKRYVRKTENKFHDNFFFDNDFSTQPSFWLQKDEITPVQNKKQGFLKVYASVKLSKTNNVETITYFRTVFLSAFLSYQGGFIASVYGIAYFLMTGF